MASVEVSSLPVKGKLVPVFRKMDAYVALMDQKRRLGADKSKVITLSVDDYTTVLTLARKTNKFADGITFKGYPVTYPGAAHG